MTFSPNGIFYDRQSCTWYYLEYISNRFNNDNTKGKELARDWKGPCAQYWCRTKMYSPCDECSLCYTQLRLWKSIKQYPSEIVGQSYWSIPDNEQWDEINETEPCFYEPLPLEPLFGQQLEDLYTQQPITHVQINYYNIQTEHPLTNIPW